MPDTSAGLADKLKSEGEKIAGFFSALSSEQWQTAIYAEGAAWTPRSILAHLVTAERGFLKLFENVRTGGGGASTDFSIDRYNARQQEKTRLLPAQELLAQFSAVRSEMVRYVAGLNDMDLAARGRHPALGETSLFEMIKMIYLHNNMHVRDIKRVLASLSASS
jgi:uncharacterized damage-inducible protein DinB